MHPYSPQPCIGTVVRVATLGGVPHHSFPAVSSRDLYHGGNLVPGSAPAMHYFICSSQPFSMVGGADDETETQRTDSVSHSVSGAAKTQAWVSPPQPHVCHH